MLSRIDREATPNGISLTVIARDHGYPTPNKATAYVNITISDINDNAPKFDKFNYVGKIREDARPGTTITTVRATDNDEGLAGMITYSITGTPLATVAMTTTVTHCQNGIQWRSFNRVVWFQELDCSSHWSKHAKILQ